MIPLTTISPRPPCATDVRNQASRENPHPGAQPPAEAHLCGPPRPVPCPPSSRAKLVPSARLPRDLSLPWLPALAPRSPPGTCCSFLPDQQLPWLRALGQRLLTHQAPGASSCLRALHPLHFAPAQGPGWLPLGHSPDSPSLALAPRPMRRSLRPSASPGCPRSGLLGPLPP